MPIEITSPANPLVKSARRLRARPGRLAAGAFLAEGLRVVLTALEHGAPVEALFACPERLRSEAARSALAAAEDRGLPVYALSERAFAALSDRDNPAGLAARVRLRVPDLDALAVAGDGLYVALDEVADPGNLGTILRTLDAAGAAGLLLTGGTDPFHPTAVRASMGSLWTVPWAAAPTLGAVLAWAASARLTTVATSARGGEDFWGADYPLPLLLLMGSERHGLPAPVAAAAGRRVTIPMAGSASSLNLAVATALLVFEVRRRGQA
jgi:TrmH family RNA methyltransferase